MMKKVLHLFRCEKFTKRFVKLINENFEIEDHVFWVYGERNIGSEGDDIFNLYSNVKYIPRIEIELRKKEIIFLMDSYDIIFFHGVFENDIIYFFYKNKNLLKKLTLYFWGGDIELNGNIRKIYIKKHVVRNAENIVTIIKEDYKIIKKRYSPRGKHRCLQYTLDMSISTELEENDVEKDKGQCIYILIGNSATITNNHVEVLDKLSKFKNCNIKVFLPLSYGDVEYAKHVIKYGENIFGDKLVPLQQFIPLHEYNFLLKNMDIAIMGMKRQQALGNVYALMYYGCKLFFYKNSILSKYFEEELECGIGYIDDMAEMEFPSFIHLDVDKRRNNKEKIKELTEASYFVKEWKEMFK